MKLIAENSTVPVYCSWGFKSNTGVLGGNILSGYKQGEISAKVARRLLVNDAEENIPAIQQAPLVYNFDYNALNRFNIDKSRLPQNSVIHNKPHSFYDEHKRLIWSTLFVGFCLVSFIILLFINIERRKRAEVGLKKAHDNLDQKVKKRTAELTKSNELLKEEIQERKQAENALEKSEKFLTETGLMAKVGGWTFNAKTHDVFFTEEINRIYEMPLDHKPSLEEAINYFHPGDRPKLETAIQKALEHGEPYNMEIRFITAKGKHLWTHTICKPIIVDGKTVKLTGTFQDITERKHVEKALRTSEAKYRTMMETMIDATYIVSSDFRIEYLNSAMKKRIGYDAMGEFCHKKIHGLDEKCPWCIHEKVMKGEQISIEVVSPKDNKTYHSSSSPIVHTDGSVSNLTVSRDLTQRMEAEERIKTSLKEKEILLQEIHHRVKNNMQVITSLLNIQANGIKNKKYADMFKESQERIRSMAIVHEILYQTDNFADINLKEYIKALLNSLYRSYKSKPDKIKLTIEVEDVSIELESAIPCGLIINELVSNALKYAFPEEREGKIRVALNSINENEILLEVSDNGVGIPEELDIRNTESVGLYLVKILAENQLEGKIELSRIDGTNFLIKFEKCRYQSKR
ncbi:MAG: PAS domain S-box protein [Deltaproteobacteria bacterium]|nr:PAS domain S-box protein [Deltaproteobacteria bacterium]